MDDRDAHVIPLDDRRVEDPDWIGRRAPACFHRNYVVDLAGRVVECAKCKTPLDPLTVLDDLARRWENKKFAIDRALACANRKADAAEKEQKRIAALRRRLEKKVAKLEGV